MAMDAEPAPLGATKDGRHPQFHVTPLAAIQPHGALFEAGEVGHVANDGTAQRGECHLSFGEAAGGPCQSLFQDLPASTGDVETTVEGDFAVMGPVVEGRVAAEEGVVVGLVKADEVGEFSARCGLRQGTPHHLRSGGHDYACSRASGLSSRGTQIGPRTRAIPAPPRAIALDASTAQRPPLTAATAATGLFPGPTAAAPAGLVAPMTWPDISTSSGRCPLHLLDRL